MKHHRTWLAILFASSFWAGAASAAIDPKMRDHLRDLMNEGGVLFEQNQFEAARDKWVEVLQVMPIPGAALWAARANVKLHRFRAAVEHYQRAIAMQPNELWKGNAQQEAQAEAKQELAALTPRVPTLKIDVEGGLAATDAVTLDGGTVSVASLSAPLLLDPGRHVVVATRNGRSVSKELTVGEAQHQSVKLRFESVALNTSSAPLPALTRQPKSNSGISQHDVTQHDVSAPPQTQIETRTPNRNQDYAMWTSFGIGAAGLVLGTTAGLVAWSKHSSLMDSGCSSEQCTDPALQSKMESYNGLLPVATAGFVIAGVGAAAGLTLWLTAPKQASVGDVRFGIGPNGLAAQGNY